MSFEKMDAGGLLDRLLGFVKVLLGNPISVGLGFTLLGIIVRMSRTTVNLEKASTTDPVTGKKIVIETEQHTTDLGFDIIFDFIPFEIPGLVPKETGQVAMSDILVMGGIAISLAGAAAPVVGGIAKAIGDIVPG